MNTPVLRTRNSPQPACLSINDHVLEGNAPITCRYDTGRCKRSVTHLPPSLPAPSPHHKCLETHNSPPKCRCTRRPVCVPGVSRLSTVSAVYIRAGAASSSGSVCSGNLFSPGLKNMADSLTGRGVESGSPPPPRLLPYRATSSSTSGPGHLIDPPCMVVGRWAPNVG